jgi:hypothetical protein
VLCGPVYSSEVVGLADFGVLEGLLLGRYDRNELGLNVGDGAVDVGATVGAGIGDEVGAAVGDEVGAGVGDEVG